MGWLTYTSCALDERAETLDPIEFLAHSDKIKEDCRAQLPAAMLAQGYSWTGSPSFELCRPVDDWELTSGLLWANTLVTGQTAIVRTVSRADTDQGWKRLAVSMDKSYSQPSQSSQWQGSGWQQQTQWHSSSSVYTYDKPWSYPK